MCSRMVILQRAGVVSLHKDIERDLFWTASIAVGLIIESVMWTWLKFVITDFFRFWFINQLLSNLYLNNQFIIELEPFRTSSIRRKHQCGRRRKRKVKIYWQYFTHLLGTLPRNQWWHVICAYRVLIPQGDLLMFTVDAQMGSELIELPYAVSPQ